MAARLTLTQEIEGSSPSLRTKFNLYWLAGLLEGEGSFLCGPPSNPNSPRIACVSTDEDVIARAAKMCGTKYYLATRRKSKPHWKQAFRFQVNGRRALALMNELKPLMGLRRVAQINKAFASYRNMSRTVLNESKVRMIRTMLRNGIKHQLIANRFGVHRTTIVKINTNHDWTQVA